MGARTTRVEIRYLGGPSALIESGSSRLLLDPTFDPPGEYLPRPGVELRKLSGPPIEPAALGPIDAVLLSHDQHLDNFDRRGRELAMTAPLILTTPEAADRIGPPARGLEPWRGIGLPMRGRGGLTVTAVSSRRVTDLRAVRA